MNINHTKLQFQNIYLIILVSAVHSLLFFKLYFGVNVLIFSLMVVPLVLIKVIRAESKLRPELIISAAAVIICSVFFSLHSAMLLMALNILVLLISYSTLFLSIKPGYLIGVKLSEYFLKLCVLPIDLLNALFTQKTKQPAKVTLKDKSSAVYWRGIIITTPIVIIVILLLSAADSVFAELITLNLPKLSIDGEIVARIMLFIAVTVLGLALSRYALKSHKPADIKIATASKPKDTYEVIMLLTALSVIFAIFSVIQIFVLFAGNESVLNGNTTYADYARSGFFQLLAATIIVYIVIAFSSRFLVENSLTYGKKLQLLLIGFLILTVASALKRLGLYQAAYGWTAARLLAYIVLLVITALLVTLSYKIYYHRSSDWLLPRYGLIAFTAFCIFNLINPESFVAAKNIDRYLKSGEIDIVYLESLSIDATDQKIRFLNTNPDLVKLSKEQSLSYQEGVFFPQYTDPVEFITAHNTTTFNEWQEASLSSQNYYRSITEAKKQFR